MTYLSILYLLLSLRRVRLTLYACLLMSISRQTGSHRTNYKTLKKIARYLRMVISSENDVLMCFSLFPTLWMGMELFLPAIEDAIQGFWCCSRSCIPLLSISQMYSFILCRLKFISWIWSYVLLWFEVIGGVYSWNAIFFLVDYCLSMFELVWDQPWIIFGGESCDFGEPLVLWWTLGLRKCCC